MAQVFISIGSNIDPYRHIAIALDELTTLLGELQLSPVYESEAIGFKGDNFLNLVAGFDTRLSPSQLATQFRKIEYRYGRQPDSHKFTPRAVDIDLLTYDDLTGSIDGIQLPREEITENAFVLRPLADLAPEVIHPLTEKSYADLWRAYDKTSQQLWRVDFEWRGKQISRLSSSRSGISH